MAMLKVKEVAERLRVSHDMVPARLSAASDGGGTLRGRAPRAPHHVYASATFGRTIPRNSGARRDAVKQALAWG